MAKKSSGTKKPRGADGKKNMPPKAKAVGGQKCTSTPANRQF